jgi:hypothetical protein
MHFQNFSSNLGKLIAAFYLYKTCKTNCRIAVGFIFLWIRILLIVLTIMFFCFTKAQN